MNTWETIFDMFLEGQASRADVEALGVDESLSDDERREIESAIRMVDQFEAAARTLAPPPGAPQRLVERLTAHVTDPSSQFTMPPWQRVDGGYASDPLFIGPADPCEGEQAINDAIESGNFWGDPSAPQVSDSDPSRYFAQARQIAAPLADRSACPIPPGAKDRLLAQLDQHRPTQPITPEDAARVMAAIRKDAAVPSLNQAPDVMAATIDGKKPEEDQKPSV